jgi:ribose 5-phosphate isomerase A
MTEKKNDTTELKKLAAFTAVDAVPQQAVVGLGSGSTLEFFIRELGRRHREGRVNVRGVPTSLQARLVGREAGIPILDPMEVEYIDLAVDGADEVDPAGNLIKGAGAAHVVEKIVAVQAKKFIIIVDESKIVRQLGEKLPVPIEVVAPALPYVLKRLIDLGGTPVIRTGSGKMGPVISELGHIIVDARFGPIADPARLDQQLNAIPGILGHGLFLHMADQVIVAKSTPEGPKLETINFTKTSPKG